MHESVDDLTAPWLGNGVQLATRILALADELDGEHDTCAYRIREVIRGEYDPVSGSSYDYSAFDEPVKAAGSRTPIPEPGS